MTEPTICNVCGSELGDPIYESQQSLTSLCEIHQQATRVHYCDECGHVQTAELHGADRFYDEDYDILSDSEDEDQIYAVDNGRSVFRTDHQLKTMLSKSVVRQDSRILDFGCAKSSMMRKLSEARPDLDVYLFDITDRYTTFWDRFVSSENYATYSVPDNWIGTFDLVTSFYSLEHVTKPGVILETIAGLLKPNGVFYGIVPNVLTNSADLVVIDHVNHFSSLSLTHLLERIGFVDVCIDAHSHRGAFVFSARKPRETRVMPSTPGQRSLSSLRETVLETAEFWTSAKSRIQTLESQLPATKDIAIYGAGFYGAFIRTSLKQVERVRCHIDQNPHLHGRTMGGVPVLQPDELPEDIDYVFVGLNPAHAHDIIADVSAFSDRELTFLFLSPRQ